MECWATVTLYCIANVIIIIIIIIIVPAEIEDIETVVTFQTATPHLWINFSVRA
jgi:voltage-gated potassium channel Kch